MQLSIQCSGLYTFIDIVGARDGAWVGPFHHYVPSVCTAEDAQHHMRGWCQKYSFCTSKLGGRLWAVNTSSSCYQQTI